MSNTVLVVEDEAPLRETLQYNLAKQGYEVQTAEDGLQAIELARRVRPDLIVLDLMLPGLDGLEVCRRLRRETNVPILMLTAKVDEVDRVVGLEVGADDYLTKPFSMHELIARVRALLRRVRMMQEQAASSSGRGEESTTAAGEVLAFDDLEINLTRAEVLWQGQPLHLKPKEYELLVFFARHKGMLLSRELILQRVWGWDYFGGSRTVDVHVRWLREKIEQNPASPTRLVTVRGMGYRFEG